MIFNTYSEQNAVINGVTLISGGHIFAKNGREILRPKGREDWLLFYIAKGSETFYLDKKVTAEAGSFILFAPGEKQHHLYSGNSTAEFYYIHFNCDALPDQISLKSSVVYSLPPRRLYSDIFEEIIDETLKKQPLYERVIAYRFLELLTFLERDVLFENHPAKANFQRIAKVVQDMNIHPESSCTLEEYAEMCNLSKYHFLRIFKQIVGLSPLDYRNRIRLEKAAELLADSNLSVEQIGSDLGFSSPAYFSSAFKKKYNLSPKKYQQKSKDV